jgi:hypothetical protein
LSDGELAGGEGGEAAEDGPEELLTGDGGLADTCGSGLLVHPPKSRASVTVPQINAQFAALALIGVTAFPYI